MGQTTGIGPYFYAAETVPFELVVEKGMSEGHKFRFPKKADEKAFKLQGDVVFKIRIVPHRQFTRKGADLIYTAEMSLEDALSGKNKKLRIPKLGKDDFVLMNTGEKIISPYTEMIAKEGLGLPLEDDSEERGDLIVKFKITEWPKVASDVKPKKKSVFKKLACGLNN